MNPLTQTVNKLIQHPDYRRSICQLYKELLRKSYRLKKLNIENASVLFEEFKVGMYESFNKQYTNTYQMTQALMKGIKLNSVLDDALTKETTTSLQAGYINIERNILSGLNVEHHFCKTAKNWKRNESVP